MPLEREKVKFVLEWIDALDAGDFRRLQQLLEDHSFLLKEGWDPIPEKKVKRLNADGTETSIPWEGSTALLEAATFGCVDLVKQSLKLVNAPTISIPSVDEEGPTLPTSQETSVESNPDDSGVGDPPREAAVLEVDQPKDGEHAEAPQKDASADGGLVTKFRKALWPPMARMLTMKRTTGEDQAETDEKNGGEISDSLRQLLVKPSGRWDVDAIAIAVICGTDEVLSLLVDAMELCQKPLYLIERSPRQLQVSDDSGERARLVRATNEFLEKLDDRTRQLCEDRYLRDPHVNFLPIAEYLFHFLCQKDDPELRSVRRDLWQSLKSLWDFVLKLKDRQGRPPFHVAIWSETTESFFQLIGKDEKVIICAATASDRAGRSPVHVAAALGRKSALQKLLSYVDTYEEVSKTCTKKWKYEVPHPAGDPIPINIDVLSKSYKFGYHHGPYSAVHAALLHRNFECATLLIEKFPKEDWGTYMYTCNRIKDVDDVEVIVEFETMELACFMGADVPVLRSLMSGYLHKSLKFDGDRRADSHPWRPAKIYKHPWHALHIVAASGIYENLCLFSHESDCQVSTLEDYEGNNALHHALRVREFGFQTHLVDHFKLERVRDKIRLHASEMKAKELQGSDQHTDERQRCIDLLLQKGCDIFKENHSNIIPFPGKTLMNNGKLMTWWSEKQTKELEATENDCVNAANAISVTAALVATTSYVGPLQPPLSYGDHGIHDHNVWVIIFMVCDTLSFYLAIAAITISLIPSLPATRKPLQTKPHTNRDMVTLSVIILFPAIVFVFIAFGSSSLAVASANVTSTVAGQLTLATTVIGGLICVVAFILFSIKLMVFILPENEFLIKSNELSKFSLTKSKSKSKFQ